MSRIGKKIIEIPKGVEVNIDGNSVLVKGPRGSLQKSFSPEMTVKREDGGIIVTPSHPGKGISALHGLTRTIIFNMIEGVTKGFEKTLEISGVGYKAMIQGRNLMLSLGFSHQITYPLPEGINASVDKQTIIILKGIDKELIGQVASNIRGLRVPEPYKGKGIKYKDERIIKKVGKAAK